MVFISCRDFFFKVAHSSFFNKIDGAAAVGTSQPTWEAFTTPKGRHTYWYDRSRGFSRWEKPSDEESQLSDSQLSQMVMSPTPKGQGAAGVDSMGPAKGED